MLPSIEKLLDTWPTDGAKQVEFGYWLLYVFMNSHGTIQEYMLHYWMNNLHFKSICVFEQVWYASKCVFLAWEAFCLVLETNFVVSVRWIIEHRLRDPTKRKNEYISILFPNPNPQKKQVCPLCLEEVDYSKEVCDYCTNNVMKFQEALQIYHVFIANHPNTWLCHLPRMIIFHHKLVRSLADINSEKKDVKPLQKSIGIKEPIKKPLTIENTVKQPIKQPIRIKKPLTIQNPIIIQKPIEKVKEKSIEKPIEKAKEKPIKKQKEKSSQSSRENMSFPTRENMSLVHSVNIEVVEKSKIKQQKACEKTEKVQRSEQKKARKMMQAQEKRRSLFRKTVWLALALSIMRKTIDTHRAKKKSIPLESTMPPPIVPKPAVLKSNSSSKNTSSEEKKTIPKKKHKKCEIKLIALPQISAKEKRKAYKLLEIEMVVMRYCFRILSYLLTTLSMKRLGVKAESNIQKLMSCIPYPLEEKSVYNQARFLAFLQYCLEAQYNVRDILLAITKKNETKDYMSWFYVFTMYFAGLERIKLLLRKDDNLFSTSAIQPKEVDKNLVETWWSEREKNKEKLPYGAFFLDAKDIHDLLKEWESYEIRAPLYDVFQHVVPDDWEKKTSLFFVGSNMTHNFEELDLFIAQAETGKITFFCPELYTCYQYYVSQGLSNKAIGAALRRILLVKWSNQSEWAMQHLTEVDHLHSKDIYRYAQRQ